jgi:hypothetical protein
VDVGRRTGVLPHEHLGSARIARQAFQNTLYWNIAGENRPVRPTTLSSHTLILGIAIGSLPLVQALLSVVNAAVKPSSARMRRVAADVFPFG